MSNRPQIPIPILPLSLLPRHLLPLFTHLLLPALTQYPLRHLSTLLNTLLFPRFESIHHRVRNVHGFVLKSGVGGKVGGELMEGLKVPEETPGGHVWDDEVDGVELWTR